MSWKNTRKFITDIFFGKGNRQQLLFVQYFFTWFLCTTWNVISANANKIFSSILFSSNTFVHVGEGNTTTTWNPALSMGKKFSEKKIIVQQQNSSYLFFSDFHIALSELYVWISRAESRSFSFSPLHVLRSLSSSHPILVYRFLHQLFRHYFANASQKNRMFHKIDFF